MAETQMTAVTVQPSHVGTAAPPGTLPGFDYLGQIDQFLVHQVVEVLEAFTSIETRNRYIVKNNLGQQMFYVAENSGICCRYCCRDSRPFTLHVYDNTKQCVMKMKRPCKCCTGCCSCCICCCSCLADELVIEAPEDNVIASVQQGQGFCVIKLNIKDAEGETQLHMRGRYCCRCKCKCCYCCGCRDIKFPVYQDGDEVGQIIKQWSGFGKEAFTEADNYAVTFPLGLATNMKAGLLGATLLLDYMMFEDQKKTS